MTPEKGNLLIHQNNWSAGKSSHRIFMPGRVTAKKP